MVKVTVGNTYPLLNPLLSSVYSNGVTVSASAAFVEEALRRS